MSLRNPTASRGSVNDWYRFRLVLRATADKSLHTSGGPDLRIKYNNTAGRPCESRHSPPALAWRTTRHPPPSIVGTTRYGSRVALRLPGTTQGGDCSLNIKQRKNMTPRSRGAIRPSFASFSTLAKTRGRRESRVRAAPAVSCAKCRKKRTRAYRFSGGNPAFPARWFYGLLRALPGDRLSCHHRRAGTCFPPT